MDFSSAPSPRCCALLDDCDASAADPRSRLYTDHLGTLICSAAADLPAMLDKAERALARGEHAVGVFSYELGAAMHGVAPRKDGGALAGILLFRRMERLSSQDAERWLDAHASADQPAGVADLNDSLGEPDFHDALARIHAYIEAGDTYQVNYTYRLRFDAYGDPRRLYRRLRARQPVPYGALVILPDGGAVLSLSPELFVHHAAGMLTTRPMKGTAAASGDPRQDADAAAGLAADPKNRAENLMIVDLLRNDLGRIAKLGSVSVPGLFEVGRYGSVLQMTSTVQAAVRADATLAEVFAALYPCGSITGAPKRRTMQIIRELEPDERGVYTGAIGWFDAPQEGRRLGDFCLSVPIRTLALRPPDGEGTRAGEMGVGAGIVHDSEAAAEYMECKLKAKFLSGLASEFELFETMRATRASGCRHEELHLQRLFASARYFGFAVEEQAVRNALRSACAALPDEGAYRMRLALSHAGDCVVQSAPLAELKEPVRLLLSTDPVEPADLFLRHKTTVRARYDAAWRAAEAQGAFDTLFFNARGELTEGGRSNVFLQLGGCWYTPPLEAGLLPGVMRAVLLADPAWNASERSLTRNDLEAAERVVVCNALRGPLAASVVWE